MKNFTYALRTLFRTPFVTSVAVISLALGIGANAAIFSLFNQMLLKPHRPDERARRACHASGLTMYVTPSTGFR